MDENIINDAIDRFDGIETCIIIEELLGLEAENKQLKKALRSFLAQESNEYAAMLLELEDCFSKQRELASQALQEKP